MVWNKDFVSKIYSAADLPDEPLPGLPLVEMIGDCRVLIERHLGVTEYSKERIIVKVKAGHICVLGTNMELIRMMKGQLIIEGTIFGVQMNRG